MDQDADEQSTYGAWSAVHEYPDPDYAAHVTQYPWAGDELEHVQPFSPTKYDAVCNAGSPSSSGSNHSFASDRQLTEYLDGQTGLQMVTELFDPDYQISDDPIP